MSSDLGIENLGGKCIVAMPDMEDPRFRQSVVAICSHSDEGAMGLILNKPIEDVRLIDLLSQLSLSEDHVDKETPVHFGGPVESGRGFVLHSTDYHSGLSAMQVGDDFSMTSTLDVLEEISKGQGPEKALFTLGYSGWSAGQLEAEIAANAWLVTPCDHDLVFDTKDARKWSAALGRIGIDPSTLSGSGGRA